MKEIKERDVFNKIAPIYGLFYNKQKRHYHKLLDKVPLDFYSYHNILDVGCGTGALCSVLQKRGLAVTGIDTANKMIDFARRRHENREITFFHANGERRLPFEDKTFDISIASFVLHGLKENDRKIMYEEMSRVTKYWVIIYDYNEKRSLLTDVLEYLEGGDYFNFIKVVKSEIDNYFLQYHVLDIDLRASWYQCTPY